MGVLSIGEREEVTKLYPSNEGLICRPLNPLSGARLAHVMHRQQEAI
jgi:hypothetical protein